MEPLTTNGRHIHVALGRLVVGCPGCIAFVKLDQLAAIVPERSTDWLLDEFNKGRPLRELVVIRRELHRRWGRP